MPPGIVISEEVALALTDATPARSRAGKTTNIPPPARAFATPPRRAARSSGRSVKFSRRAAGERALEIGWLPRYPGSPPPAPARCERLRLRPAHRRARSFPDAEPRVARR